MDIVLLGHGCEVVSVGDENNGGRGVPKFEVGHVTLPLDPI